LHNHKVVEVRSTFSYKKGGGGPSGHLSLIHPKEQDFGHQSGID